MTTRKTRSFRAVLAGAVLTLASATPVLAQYGGSDKPASPTAVSTEASTKFDFGSFTLPKIDFKPLQIKTRTVTITILGKPFSFVELYIESDPVFLGKFQADANGKVEATLNIPASIEAGNHTIVAKGTDTAGKAIELRQSVVLAAAEVAPVEPSSLSLTGSNARGIAAVGGVLLVVGGAATFATRRRLTDAE